MGTSGLIGKSVPDFTVTSSDGTPFTLSDYVGKGVPVAIFFFPKQGTPVCDAEACSFEKSWPDVGKTDSPLTVIGISSGGTVAELAPWKLKNHINYPILSDEKHLARDAFKVGKALFGTQESRATFFVDKHGIVRAVLDGGLSFVLAGKHPSFIKQWLAKTASEA